MFPDFPGPADVLRPLEKSICGKGQAAATAPCPPSQQRGGGLWVQGSKTALKNWIYLKQHTIASERLHLLETVVPSHPSLYDLCRWFLWCQSRSNTISFCLHHGCAVSSFITCTVFTLLLLTKCLETKDVPNFGDYKRLFCTGSYCLPPLLSFSQKNQS